MRINSRERHAVIALVDVAMYQENGFVALTGISQRLEISVSYLEKIFARLRLRGIIDAARGSRGGYRLARHASDVSVGDIIQALDGEPAVTDVARKSIGCDPSVRVDWITQNLWFALNRKIMEHLQSVSLSELIDQRRLHIRYDGPN